ALYGRTGPRLARLLATADLDLEPYRRMMACIPDRTRTLLVAGRGGGHARQDLERNTARRGGLYAGGRGREAGGPAAAGLVRSLLGYYIEAVGLEAAFRTLGSLADAACLDSRVLLAHLRVSPSAEDRFNSDLGRADLIRDPTLREITLTAARAPIPVLLGGHALVSGGLMALVQAAWDEHDRGLALTP